MGQAMLDDLSVRVARVSDAGDVAALFIETFDFYGLPSGPFETIKAHILSDVVAEQTTSTVLLGYVNDELAGYATYAVMFPAPGESGQLYMKELFIRKAFRGQGVGRQLLKSVAEIAVASRCSRLDWTSDTNNPDAIAFYQKIGASMLEERRYFRMDGDALVKFAGGGGS